MPRADASAAVSVERFFQFSLLGLVASGYLAVVPLLPKIQSVNPIQSTFESRAFSVAYPRAALGALLMLLRCVNVFWSKFRPEINPARSC